MQVPLFSVQAELQVYNSQEGRSACGSVGLLQSYSPGLLSDGWFSPEALEWHVPGLSVGMHSLWVDYGFTPSQMLPHSLLPAMGYQNLYSWYFR